MEDFVKDKAVEIFKSKDGQVMMNVRLIDETTWLTQKQLTDLFQVTAPTINEHIKNIFAEKELESGPTIRKFRIVQIEGNRQVKRNIDHYNLDMILSVGYRVKSGIATQFRQWATQVLKNQLVEGYSFNQKRLETIGVDVSQLMSLVQKMLSNHELAKPEGLQLTKLIGDYARSWTLLQAYDDQNLADPETKTETPQILTVSESLAAIKELKKELIHCKEATKLFGQLRGNGLDSSLGAIEQTFGGEPLYPTINSRAAHLLYFIIKNHPFTDGNKRIGSFLFLLYLGKNQASLNKKGIPKISDNTIIPLALLVAESDPKQKELIIRLIQHLLEN